MIIVKLFERTFFDRVLGSFFDTLLREVHEKTLQGHRLYLEGGYGWTTCVWLRRDGIDGCPRASGERLYHIGLVAQKVRDNSQAHSVLFLTLNRRSLFFHSVCILNVVFPIQYSRSRSDVCA